MGQAGHVNGTSGPHDAPHSCVGGGSAMNNDIAVIRPDFTSNAVGIRLKQSAAHSQNKSQNAIDG